MPDPIRPGTHSDNEAVADPSGAIASPRKRRFLQFTMRQLLLLLALSGVMLGIVAPRVHQRYRYWQLDRDNLRIVAANNDLQLAVRTNDIPLARRALEAKGGFNAPLPGQVRPVKGRLLCACVAKGQIEMMKLLLDSGASPNWNDDGLPLFVAVSCDQPPEVRIQMVRMLVAAGADPHMRGGGIAGGIGNAMDLAFQRGDAQMGALLREYGLPYGPREMVAFDRLDELRQAVRDDPELPKRRFKSMLGATGPVEQATLLAIALYRGYREMSLFLIDAGAPLDTRLHFGRTLLHVAAIGGDPELIRLLVARGLDVNAVDDHFNDTPLEYAVGKDKRDAVAALIEAGGGVNHQDGSGRTFLHAAVMGNRVEIAKMLLAAGADPTIANIKGETPLDVARAQNPAMISLLEEAAERLSKER
ncbi:MAG TPA: ankyrin repeat domain-containing protein [Pirellulales bacterium]|nr:ankyrin repeat domain-containing protein [Pirellulales bacterium]